jgi:hypothetical protein
MTNGGPADRGQVAAAYGKLPLSFEPNQGQADSSIDFLARGNGYNVLVGTNQALLALRPPAAGSPIGQDPSPVSAAVESPPVAPLGLRLVGANPQSALAQEDVLPGTVNYFQGSDPSRWRTDLPTYATIRDAGVYPGIDVVYHGEQGQLEYDFDLAPGSDPGAIRLSFEGADQVELTAAGDLALHTPAGELHQPKPVLYQESEGGPQPVDGGYLLGQQDYVSFWVGSYDPSRPLVIDPTLAYSTFLSGSRGSEGTGIAVDVTGNAYVSGLAFATDFPTSPGSVQKTFGSGDCGGFPCTNVFVSKLNPAGTAVIYTDFLAGAALEQRSAIAVDTAGNAYLAGTASTASFPTTPGVIQPSPPANKVGDNNAFVSKLNPSGTTLVYSTFLSGSLGSQGAGIAVDAAGNAYVTGNTFSADFPTTPGAFQPTLIGVHDAFVSKLNPTATTLAYSTFLGGAGNGQADGNTFGQGLAADGAGNAYVTGSTGSPTFPTTPGSFQPTCPTHISCATGFVTKMNPTGTALVYSTYLGGTGSDQGSAIAVDAPGNAYLTGLAFSADFPTTPGAFQPTCPTHFSCDSGFVSKLNPAGSALVYSTFLGGGTFDTGVGIGVDGPGDAWVIGSTASADFPTTPDAVKRTLHDTEDAFVSKLNPSGTALLFSTFLGGDSPDSGASIAVDHAGNAYVTGETESSDFPTTPGVLQPTCGGVFVCFDAFVAKFSTGLNVMCTTTLSGAQGSLVIQPNGTTCLEHATVSGNVQVRPGARLFVEHSSTTGPIVADAPAFFGLCDSSVRGSVSVSDASGFVLVGDPTDDACGGNTVTAGLVLQNNHSGVEVAANHVGGSVSISGTTGSGPFPEDQGAEIEGNVIGGSLVCSGNNPAPKNDGQPNTVTAARSGQCASL